ncbi:MAG: ABC transporter ATP-binding protein [Candidatus Nomurabacteria bacterium]|jgi:putative ABC transport system ATP-binding protein|nr:ABC transporter ATP-binding protein [Candidatus Nomurabacteria bacterium]
MATTSELTPVISLSGLVKQFGFGEAGTRALDGVDLTIEQGEFVAIMGPSGCGKTTLLNIIGLLDKPTAGSYRLNGRYASKLSRRRQAKLRATDIGFVFQSFNLLPRLSVIENVALPLTYTGGARYKQLEKASVLLKTFGLGDREYYLPNQLSGGQTQRVAIARALIGEPSIILADEPTGNLDSRNSEIIMDELTRIHRRGNTIIMVTHNPELLAYASRVIHMKDGKISQDLELTDTAAHRQTSHFISQRKLQRKNPRQVLIKNKKHQRRLRRQAKKGAAK